jgi:hypothetical protein
LRRNDRADQPETSRACGCEANTGDGGINLQLPHKFPEGSSRPWLPCPRREYGAGMIFAQEDNASRA